MRIYAGDQPNTGVGGNGGWNSPISEVGLGGGTTGGQGGYVLDGISAGAGGTAGAIGGGGGGYGDGRATGGYGGNAVGGIYVGSSGVLFLGLSTISANAGAGGGGGSASDYDGVGGFGGAGVGGIGVAGVLHYSPAQTIFSTNTGSGGGGGEAGGGVAAASGASAANIYSFGGTIDSTFVFNIAPAVSNLNGDSVSYVEGATAVLIDSGSNATVVDTDNAGFSGGNVTVSIVSNRVPSEDVLAIVNQGTGSGQVGVSGSNVTYGGTTIGTFAGGSGTNDLVVTLNGSATPAAAQALLRTIAYADSNTTEPATATRTVRVTVNDGSGGTSGNADVSVSVVGVNDAPALSATGGTPTYTENGGEADLFSGVGISTVETGQTINSITLTVSGLLDGSMERLGVDGSIVALTNGNSLTTATNAMAVSVSVTGSTATVVIAKPAGISAAAAQTLVDGLGYANVSENPSPTTHTVTLTSIRDSGGTANGGVDTTALAVASTVIVVAANDAPILATGVGTTAFTEAADAASTPVVVDDALTVSDVDSTTLASATVSITGNFHAGEDVLSFTNDGSTMGNVAAIYTSGTGVLTMVSSGASATLAQWQAALRSVTYTNTSDAPNTSTRAVSFSANDGTDASPAATRSVSVAATNDSPVNAVPSAQNMLTDATLTFSSGNGNLVSTSDADAAASAIQATLAVSHGTLSLSGTTGLAFATGSGTGDVTMTFTGAPAAINSALGGMIYSPTSGYSGPDTLQFTTSDQGNTGAGGAKSDSDSVSITVTNAPQTLIGGKGRDVLTGGTGNDTIDGGGNADTMTGGQGDDTYYVDKRHDVVIELPGEGQDTVISSVSHVLAANVENLTLTENARRANGNELDNVVIGNDNKNVLQGRLGADTLTGGLGADRFVFGSAEDSAAGSPDTITDFNAAEGDRIFLRGMDWTYIGAAAFGADATGQLRFDAATHTLQGSTNAGATPEFAVVLTGITALAVASLAL